MKTQSINQFFNTLGIQTELVNESKGIIELPYVSGMMVAVSDTHEAQLAATTRFREVSTANQTTIASSVDLTQAGGTTVVPGVDVMVPVFSVYAGQFQDKYATNGNKVTNNRLLTLMNEMDELNSGKARVKTPYLSWLCKSLGINRPRTLEALQDLIIEAALHPDAASVPAIEQLLLGRGTRHAVLTVGSTVEYRDTEPTVNESDWIFCDLERLVAGGITDAQASVMRKTSKAMWKALDCKPAPAATPVVQTQKAQTIQMLVA